MAGHARYTVLQKIADGGMAEIYLGTQHGAEGFHRPIVIKRIRGVFSGDPKFRNMLIDEAHIAMSLVHSNIVQVLDLGTARGSDFLVLELVDGWDLNKLLSRSAACGLPLPPALCLYVMVETCRGLAYAHTRRRDGRLLGIVHRDISPHNVLVSEQGEVKLSDFGIATALGKREQTLAGTVKGKLGFMSPEQARGEPLDHRSDVFSVGTTLYLLVTGRRPYQAGTDLEILLRMQQADFPAPETARPDLAPAVAAIVRKAMEKRPEDRYQSAEDLLVDLEAVQRSVYGPAGQTELKRWLAALSERDGMLPVSLRPARPAAEQKPPSSGELPQGSEIMLEEVEPDAMLPSEPPSPPPAAAPAPAAPQAPSPAPSEPDAVPAASSPEAGPAPAPVPEDGPTAAPAASHEPAASPVPSAAPWSIPPVPPIDSQLVHATPTFVDELPGSGSLRRSAILLGVGIAALALLGWWLAPVAPSLVGIPLALDASAVVAAPPRPVDPDPDEEADAGAAQEGQLAQAEGEVVLDAGTGSAEGVAADDGSGSDERQDTVSVRFVTTPPGAAVSVMKKTYGVTPINVRFKPELMYDVVLQKQGYRPLEKRLYVPKRKDQVFSFALEKKRWWQF